jgi:hypothetical protein
MEKVKKDRSISILPTLLFAHTVINFTIFLLVKSLVVVLIKENIINPLHGRRITIAVAILFISCMQTIFLNAFIKEERKESKKESQEI